jgi:hypothetical protein
MKARVDYIERHKIRWRGTRSSYVIIRQLFSSFKIHKLLNLLSGLSIIYVYGTLCKYVPLTDLSYYDKT